jgi:hypothetical protein
MNFLITQLIKRLPYIVNFDQVVFHDVENIVKHNLVINKWRMEI